MALQNHANSKEVYQRLFVAFPFPNDLLKHIDAIHDRNNAIENIRWTPSQNLHVTIFFLGEVNAMNLDKIKERIKNEVVSSSPFMLEFEKFALKKGRKHSGMIWLQFSRNIQFASLSLKLNHALEEFLIHPATIHDPVPHITLARWKGNLKMEEINGEINSGFRLQQINQVELWQSVNSPSGVIYKSLEKFEMKGNEIA